MVVRPTKHTLAVSAAQNYPVVVAGLQKRFSNAYQRLCHFVAIRRDAASVTAAEDGVIRAAIYLCESATAPDVHEISENAKAFFSLAFSDDEITRAIERLDTAGQVVRQRDGAVALTPKAIGELELCVHASEELEATVRAEWLQQLDESSCRPEGSTDGELWRCLQQYLAVMFARHGVQTLEVMSPAAVEDDSTDVPASDILDSALSASLPQVPKRAGRRAMQLFLRERTPMRTRYLAELLDGTFSFFALTVDNETRKLLRESLPPLKLFVDTNFIFGMLELHSNAFVAVSKELADLIREQRFPFQLYYHPITAIEFRSVVDYYHRKLAGGRWPSSMSRVLLRVGDLSGVERKYHEINAEHATSVDDFFTRYRNIDRLLGPAGIKPYRIDYESWLGDDLTLDIISKYRRFLEPREKPFDVLQHDVILWRTLQTVRQNNPGPFGAGAFFLTCDYAFWRFEHSQLSRGAAGVSVLPNVLLQLLRPFVPRTADFDLSFVSTFALPEFRTIHAATDQAVSRVAGIIRLYSDLPEEVAVGILTDDALLAKVTKLDESDPAIHELIESAIAVEASRWKEEADRLRDEVAAQHLTNKQVSQNLANANEMAATTASALESVQQQLANERAALAAATSAAADVRRTRQLDDNKRAAELALLSARTRMAESAAKATRDAHEHERRAHAAKTHRLVAIASSLAHVLVALGTSAVAARYFAAGSRQENAIVAGALIYVFCAATAEFTSWFRRRKQRFLIRLLWYGTVVAAVALAWFDRSQLSELSIVITILVAVGIPLFIFCGQSET